MEFDNYDSRIRYYELLLERDLEGLPVLPLPEGYRFVFFQPGDRDAWIEIEKSAKEFSAYEQGLAAWDRYYGGREALLPRRMVFVENARGEKVATATALFDITGRDRSGSGWLHWVAVRRDFQGRGLSKPLIAYVLGVMRELGYTHGKIPTQCTSWVACKVYLDLGFRPIPKNAVNSRDGWRIVKALTGHPALEEFTPASLEEILAEPSAPSNKGGKTMKQALEKYRAELAAIKEAGTWKGERIITTPQRSRIDTTAARQVVNMCANNYLGLSNNPELIAAAKESYDKWGFGLSSVRFICGTQSIHKELEKKLSEFLGMDDAILYSSCFDANGGLFETLLGPEDAVISDELNHASIIDGVRLCKAKRFRYKNNNMEDLRAQLTAVQEAGCKVKLIATDGVFSMDGYIANLKGICDLADEFDALVMVDDSHAVGFMGDTGRGTPEFCGVRDRVDIITGTFGKALGGASGGYTAAHQEIVDLLRQRSRPYLFSNTVAPAICAATLKTIELLSSSTALRDKVHENTAYFREKLSKVGFDVLEGSHPIVAVMLYDAKVAAEFAARMLEKGVYVVSFSYPVVPQGKARIRTQVSAGHTKEDLDFAVECFQAVKQEMGI